MADIDISALCALAGQAVADLVEAVDAGACPTVSRKATFGQIVDVITGDITVNACGVSALAACSVAAAEITNCTVGTAELAACSVTATEIAACAVGTSEIAACGVGTSEIVACAVGTSEIAALAVDTAQIAASAVETAKINDLAVTEGKIANDAVTLAKMATGTDGNLISFDACTNPVAVATGTCGQVLTSNGAGAAPTFQAAGGGGCGWTVKVKTSDESITSDTTLSNDTCLQICADANSTYALDARIWLTPNATADFKYAFSIPTNASGLKKPIGDWDAVVELVGQTITTATAVLVSGASNFMIEVHAKVETGACAGVIAFQWAQNTSNVCNTTLNAGSWVGFKKA